MTQEQKDLLLKDLCARLPYNVVMTNKSLSQTHYILTGKDLDEAYFDDEWDDVPCLRPMSSMTEEEKKDRDNIVEAVYDGAVIDDEFENVIKYMDWLNAHHFDHRGLIPKGLAIEAPKDMYKLK